MPSISAVDEKTGRKFYLDDPDDLKPGEPVTFILNLHGTTPLAQHFYQHGYFSAHQFAASHNLIIVTPSSVVVPLLRIWGRRNRISSGIRADLDLRSVSNCESVGVRAGFFHRPRAMACPSLGRPTGPCAELDLLSWKGRRLVGQARRAAIFFAARFAMP